MKNNYKGNSKYDRCKIKMEKNRKENFSINYILDSKIQKNFMRKR